MIVDERAIIAANNNADLYEAMFTTQGLQYERFPHAFVGKDRPPPYYSNLTVVSPNHAQDINLRLRDLVEKFDGAVFFKDSFYQAELQHDGFNLLFEASWIWREAGRRTSSINWEKVEDHADLALWEEAWKAFGSPTEQRMFKDAFLELPDICFLGLKNKGVFEAGCIANKSEGCIGISNVFSKNPTADVYAHAADAVTSVDANLPIVGYEAGEN